MPSLRMLWVIFTMFNIIYCRLSLLQALSQCQEVITKPHAAVLTDDVLSEGGNAVDVSVTAALCLGVVSSTSSSLGGGAFMVIRLANRITQVFDMRETATLLASENMYGGYSNLKHGCTRGSSRASRNMETIGRPFELLTLVEYKISMDDEGVRTLLISNGVTSTNGPQSFYNGTMGADLAKIFAKLEGCSHFLAPSWPGSYLESITE